MVISGYLDSERGAAREALDADGNALADGAYTSKEHVDMPPSKDSEVTWRDVNFNFAASPEATATQRIGLGDFWDD